jgi:membrane-bound serine protease (ClpP class)
VAGMRWILALFALLSLSVHHLAAADQIAGPGAPRVAYIPIDGPIDHGKAKFFKRALADAKAKGATTAVVHLTTDGGLLDAGRDMMSAALGEEQLRLVAFIDNRAYSAGSLIAYGHHEILVGPNATLGDIGVIQVKQDGSIEYAPEKIETVVRALLRSTADNRGWDTAKLMKMVARNQGLWRYDLGQGAHWVIEDDLPKLLADHPELERKDELLLKGGERIGYLYLPADRLLSYTAKKAVEDGMATALVDDLDAVYARLGTTKAQVIDCSPTEIETTSWVLAGFAPMLAGLAVLLIIIEFKFPMGGLFFALAAACGLGFFVCQYFMELANYGEAIAILIGLALIVVELFVLPLGGLMLATGGILMVVGLLFAFMPDVSQFKPETPEYAGNFLNALASSLLAVIAVTIGVVLGILALPRLALRTGLATATAISGSSAGSDEVASGSLVGRQGTARSDLAPGGVVLIDGRELSGQDAHGAFIAAGTPVTVVAMRFGELIVEPVRTPGA